MDNLFLSKSKYLTGIQCKKLLWHHYNAKEQIPPPDSGLQAIFDQGHEVGELAKKLYPNGLEVDWNIGFDEVIKCSKELLKERKPLFEAGFKYKNAYSRVDVLEPTQNGKWNIVEVKSTTKVHDINHHDVAFQKYCYEGSGIEIDRCYLMHLNNAYVRKGELELDELFEKEDITNKVNSLLPNIENNINSMLESIALESCPEIKIGIHCNKPFECALKPICWGFLIKNNPLSLYRISGKKAFKLIDEGMKSILDIKDDSILNEKQMIQKRALQEGAPQIDKDAISHFLKILEYPLYYLDFETFNSPIPMFDRTKPYMQVPFQFSLHILDSPKVELKHYSFLADGKIDPRPAFMVRLKELLGEKGNIVVYNQSFETNCLKECAEAFPEYKDWVNKTIKRIVDLLVPFRNFDYYHPDQCGSASIKKVLPVVTGNSYEGMDISNGSDASKEFARVTFNDVEDEDRLCVRNALEKYCKLDTQAMVDIIEKLEEMVN
jgi:hypothetical protein